MRVNDAVTGFLLLLFSILVMVHVSIGWSWLVETEFSGFPRAVPGKPGPALFPFILGFLFAICALILIVRGLKSKAAWVILSEWPRSPAKVFNWVAILTVVISYQFLDEWIGFLPLAVVLLFFLMKILQVRTVTALLASAGTSLFIHTLFVKILLVPLPWGLLDSIAW